MMLTEPYYYCANHPAAKAVSRTTFNFAPAGTKAACAVPVIATFNSRHNHKTARSGAVLLDSQSRNGLAGNRRSKPGRPASAKRKAAPNPATRYSLMDRLTEHTFFPFSAHPCCAPPESEELAVTLRRVLQRAATGNTTPQLARLARHALAELRRIQDAEGLGAISALVAGEFHLRPVVLKSKARGQHTAFCRHLAMHLCRRITGKPFAVIGTHFNRNHASVIYACQLVERRMARDAAFGLFIKQLELHITEATANTATANA
jgi:hypothetical protein